MHSIDNLFDKIAVGYFLLIGDSLNFILYDYQAMTDVDIMPGLNDPRYLILCVEIR